MKRSISPLAMIQEQQQDLKCLSSIPRRKRLKKACGASTIRHSTEEDDVAALLLSLASKRSSLDAQEKDEMKLRLHANDDPKEPLSDEDREGPHRVVSDDEDDDHHQQAATQKKTRVPQSANTNKCSFGKSPLQMPLSTSASGDWRAFSRPIGPPPRLPMVPAGYVFPPRNIALTLSK